MTPNNKSIVVSITMACKRTVIILTSNPQRVTLQRRIDDFHGAEITGYEVKGIALSGGEPVTRWLTLDSSELETQGTNGNESSMMSGALITIDGAVTRRRELSETIPLSSSQKSHIDEFTVRVYDENGDMASFSSILLELWM